MSVLFSHSDSHSEIKVSRNTFQRLTQRLFGHINGNIFSENQSVPIVGTESSVKFRNCGLLEHLKMHFSSENTIKERGRIFQKCPKFQIFFKKGKMFHEIDEINTITVK